MIFFAENGITSTSANTVANLAKEYIQSKQTALDNLHFYQTKVGLISEVNTRIIRDGNNDDQLSQVPSMLDDIAQAKSLIAWLREAIKARESLTRVLNNFCLQEYCGMVGIEYPESPERGHILTEDEYYGSLSLKERNRYYQLETYAAVIGKYIHPDGVFAKAREDMKNKSHEPYEVRGTGRDAIIYSYELTVTPDKVEEQFFALQQKHRDIQKQLNSIKFECEKAIAESQMKVMTEYEAAVSEYNGKLNALNAEFTSYKQKESQAIRALKIVIPDSLKDIYEKVNSLGK